MELGHGRCCTSAVKCGGNPTADHAREVDQTLPELGEENHTNNNKLHGASVFYSNGSKCCSRAGSVSRADVALLSWVESLLIFI